MLAVLVIIFILGAVLLIVGLRGRIEGTDPHCRRCGFNLRGRDPGSPRCPECGTVLSEAVMRTGLRRRRPAMLSVGAALAVLSAGVLGFVGYQMARDYDWAPWKPTTWLLADIETGSGASYAAAVKELENRVAVPHANQTKVNAIVDVALAHQKDRQTRWNDAWAEIIQAAGQANHLSADRAKRYLEQSVAVSLRVRPKARRGRYASVWLSYGIDRLTNFSIVRGTWHVSPLMIDSVEIADHVFSNSGEEQEFGVGGTNSYGTGFPLTEKELIGLKDGKHQLTATYEQTLRQTAPFAAGPVTVRIPLTAPIELFPKDAIVDEFKADPEEAPKERAAILGARVLHNDEGNLEVRVKTGSLPVALAVKAVLTQGQARESLGTMLIAAGQKPRWISTSAWQHKTKQFISGKVDLHLIPDQDASDYQQDLGTYWGREIVIPNITVDAPYRVPFVNDESLRPAVEKALTIESITRGKESSPRRRLSISWNAHSPPVKLAYQVYLSFGGSEVRVGDGSSGSIMPKGQNYGFGRSCDDIDPAGRATSCDVIFRPDPNWEAQSSDLDAPWGGEVIIHDVPIKNP